LAVAPVRSGSFWAKRVTDYRAARADAGLIPGGCISVQSIARPSATASTIPTRGSVSGSNIRTPERA